MALKRKFELPDEPDEISDFMKEMRSVSPAEIERFLNKHLTYSPERNMWVLENINEYVGTCVDRANAQTFLKKYPGIVAQSFDTNFGQLYVGIPKNLVENIDSAAFNSLSMDLKKRDENGVLDIDHYKKTERERIIESWDLHLENRFFNLILNGFTGYRDQIKEAAKTPGKLFVLAETARDRSGLEWEEEPGANYTVDIHKLFDSIDEPMLQSWIGAQQESSLMEGREYSCVMAPASPEIHDAVLRWGKMFILDEELYTDPDNPDGFGRENEVHVTVKFGLHEAEPSEELLRILEETQPFEIEIGKCSLFENEKFDVVKFDIAGEGLYELNRRVSQLPNSDQYPDYHPHMTVAYVTKGTCRGLVGKPLLDTDDKRDLRFLAKAVVFSSKNKKKTTLFLGKPNLSEAKVEHPFRGGAFLGHDYDVLRAKIIEHIDRLREIGELDGLDFEIIDVILTGSRVHQKTAPREDSDFDAVVLYRGNYSGTDKRIREDDMFNALNRDEESGGEPLCIDGIKVDMNPIYVDRYHDEPHIKQLILGEDEQSSSSQEDTNMGEADRRLRAVTNKGAETLAKPTPLRRYMKMDGVGTRETQPWTLEQAKTWLNSIRPELEQAGYEAEIVGSVQKHGESEKDLDILLIPRKKHNVAAAVAVLAKNSTDWGRADSDLFNARLPDGHIVEFWFANLIDLIDDTDQETGDEKTPDYADDATKLSYGSWFSGGLSRGSKIKESIDDEEMDIDQAKEVYGLNDFKEFTTTDVDSYGTYKRIFADRKELIYAPTDWQRQGLQQTASGYGKKLNSGYKIAFNGKVYRVYATCYGNASSLWFTVNGEKIFVG